MGGGGVSTGGPAGGNTFPQRQEKASHPEAQDEARCPRKPESWERVEMKSCLPLFSGVSPMVPISSHKLPASTLDPTRPLPPPPPTLNGLPLPTVLAPCPLLQARPSSALTWASATAQLPRPHSAVTKLGSLKLRGDTVNPQLTDDHRTPMPTAVFNTQHGCPPLSVPQPVLFTRCEGTPFIRITRDTC